MTIFGPSSSSLTKYSNPNFSRSCLQSASVSFHDTVKGLTSLSGIIGLTAFSSILSGQDTVSFKRSLSTVSLVKSS